jgi:hypothetical protein
MNHDQRIALLQAACTLAQHGASMENGGIRGRVLFYYGWLQKIVESPYDLPNKAERDRLVGMRQK